jgi:hypothetical protein
VSLESHGFAGDDNSNVLSDLLAPAEQQGGWASVKDLELKVPGHLCQAELGKHVF